MNHARQSGQNYVLERATKKWKCPLPDIRGDTVFALFVLAAERLRHASLRASRVNGGPYLANATHCSAKIFRGLFCCAAFPHQYKAAALSLGKPDDAVS